MSPTIMSGLKPSSRIASAPPSTPTSTGLHVAHVRAQRAQVLLVVDAAHDHQRRAVAEVGVEVGQLDLAREQLALLADVGHRVLGERLERLADAAPALPRSARVDGLAVLDLALARRPRRRGRAAPPRTVDVLAVLQHVEERRARHVDEVHAGLGEDHGPLVARSAATPSGAR